MIRYSKAAHPGAPGLTNQREKVTVDTRTDEFHALRHAVWWYPDRIQL